MEMFDCCVEENKQTPNVLLLQNSRHFTKNKFKDLTRISEEIVYDTSVSVFVLIQSLPLHNIESLSRSA